MYREAKMLGIFPPKDLLEGIETDIKVAKAINAISKPAKKIARALERSKIPYMVTGGQAVLI